MHSNRLLLILALLFAQICAGYGKIIEDQQVLGDIFGDSGRMALEDNPSISDDQVEEETSGPSGLKKEGANLPPEPNGEGETFLPEPSKDKEDEEDRERVRGPLEENNDVIGGDDDAAAADDDNDDDNDEDDDDDHEQNAFGDDIGDNKYETANGYEEEGVVLKRRKRQSRKEWVLSRDDHPLDVTLVKLDDIDHRRVKRTSYNITTSTWPHRIPYAYEGFDESLKHQLEEVLKFLQDHLCVKFVHEQDFDHDNPNWFKEHGYSTNAYIRFRSSSKCAAVYGRGESDQGGRTVKPCTQWVSMMHEVIHSLGGIHSQNYPYRERYIVLHKDNIQDGVQNNFEKFQPNSKEVEYENFDPTSLLMYSRGFFSNNGLSTFDYVRPEMAHLTGPATYRNIVLELNKNYKCVELFCGDENTDCGPGYMGYIKQKCACVCPEGFDPASKCKSIINEADTSITWPNTAFSLNKGEDCPAGAEIGRIPLHVGQFRMNLKKMSASRGVVNFDRCTKTSGSGDFESWPIGSYCIGKVEDIACSTPFKEGEITMTTKSAAALTGSVGDVTVDGNKVTMKYCCRKEGSYRIPMKLPTDKPFRLAMNDFNCQEIEGMWTLPGYLILKGKASKKGAGPRANINRVGLKMTSCYYQPPTYGCSEEIVLDTYSATKTVSVPAGAGGREPNRRCFYYFQAPEGSRLRLTFKKLSLHSNDRVMVKRFNLLENPYQIDMNRPPYQMITESSQLQIEYWSYFESRSKWTGATLTVDLLSPQNLCYNAATKGADYAGMKDISETYESCVPWSEATSCPDFPWDRSNGINLLNSGKRCRNLDTTGMFQPWCYSYVNGTMCQRRYCDVCNEAEPVDILGDCKKYIDSNTNFCTDALGRFGCFKSCGMDASPYNKADVKCGKPVLPAEITATEALQESYEVGTKVATSCGEIECTAHGWTQFDDTCSDRCVDVSQLCINAITKYAEFCTNENSKVAAEKYCRKTCGKCESASCSVPSAGSYSLVAGSASSVSTGENVEFACNDGLMHVSGDLRRACSVSGDLLGDDPVCKAAPADINLEQIFEKSRSIPRMTAYLMMGFGLDVPFDGKLTRWYYYCNNDLTVTLLVYRRTDNSQRFRLVGYNEAPCVRGWPWSHDVPAADQIAVKKGDVLGVYDAKYSIAAQSCQSNPNKWAPVVSIRMRKVKQLLRKKVARFNRESCAHVAVGCRVDPSEEMKA